MYPSPLSRGMFSRFCNPILYSCYVSHPAPNFVSTHRVVSRRYKIRFLNFVRGGDQYFAVTRHLRVSNAFFLLQRHNPQLEMDHLYNVYCRLLPPVENNKDLFLHHITHRTNIQTVGTKHSIETNFVGVSIDRCLFYDSILIVRFCPFDRFRGGYIAMSWWRGTGAWCLVEMADILLVWRLLFFFLDLTFSLASKYFFYHLFFKQIPHIFNHEPRRVL